MFFVRKRILALEQELKWRKHASDNQLDKIYAIERDISRIVQFMGAYFEDVNERRLVKKGGPEKGG